MLNRAKNIVRNLGGIEPATLYFQKHKTFAAQQNCGAKTNLQLTSYFEYLISENKSLKKSPQAQKIKVQLPTNILDCLDYYVIKKSDSTVRVMHFFQRIERNSDFNKNNENKFSFLKKYFLDDFDFINEKLLGTKSVKEVYRIRKGILAIANYQKPGKVKIDRSQILISEIYRTLNYKLSKEEIAKAISRNGDEYILHLLISMYLLKLGLRDATQKILCWYYFSHSNLTTKSVSVKAKVTQERARQIIKELNNNIIPETIDLLLLKINNLSNEISKYNENNIIKIIPENSISSIYKNLRENERYFVLLYAHILKDNYLHINEVLFMTPKNLNFFNKSDSCVFISTKFIQRTNFYTFINWIIKEITDREKAEITFDLRVLIKQYFKINNFEIDFRTLNELVNIIETQKAENPALLKILQRRYKKRKIEDDICNIIQKYLFSKKNTRKTEDIQIFLKTKNIEISRLKLLKILGKNTTFFKRAGFGYWGLKEMENFKSGSLREIVREKLKDMRNPIHISELLDYINQFHPTTENSLIRNLGSDENSGLVYFNCAFIGLKSKKYIAYWHKLPRVDSRPFKRIEYAKSSKNEQEYIKYVHKKYSYPVIHIRYLLAKKQQGSKWTK